MREIRIQEEHCLSDEAAEALGGTLLGPEAARIVVAEDARVYRPDGSLLLVLKRNAIPLDQCRAAYGALREAATVTENRGMAAGPPDQVGEHRRIGIMNGKVGFRSLKADGTLSKQTFGAKVRSGVVGYYDRYENRPYCRQTAYTEQYPDRLSEALPLIQAVDAWFRELVSDRWFAQKEAWEHTSSDFRIPGTCFTTLTVNKNWQTAVHQDKGDFRPGFGCITVFRAGQYSGGLLCFPQCGVGVDLRTRDVLFSDFHAWHGNTPLVGGPGPWERISVVLYYRENMYRCGSAEQELRRAKVTGGRPGKRWDD